MDYRILRVRETLAIDLDGFIALISSELVEGGMKTAVRRDCKILREALKAEIYVVPAGKLCLRLPHVAQIVHGMSD